MILVTGATGLVGSHIAYQLTSSGSRIRALRRDSSSMKVIEDVFAHYSSESKTLLERIEWVDGDLTDLFSLEEALKDVDYVYHAGAMVSFDPSDRESMLRTNIEGTAHLVNASMDAGVKKFCHISSVAALGKTIDGQNISEDTWWKSDPSNSWYAISKYGAEREVWRSSEEGLQVVIVNPSVIIGPGDPGKSSNALFALAKKGFSWYTEGSGGFVDARDVAHAAILLMNSTISQERFVLNAENSTYRQFADQVLSSFGHKPTSFRVGRFLLGLIWRWERITSALFGRKARITKETAASAMEKLSYDGTRITRALPFTYRALSQSVADSAAFYKKFA